MARLIRLSLPLLVLSSGLANAAVHSSKPIAHFSGNGPESTATLHVDTPWLLNRHVSLD